MEHDAAYHEQYEAEHGTTCPECRSYERMTNENAIDLLADAVSQAQDLIQSAVWAQAFLEHGGEATWDAVKSVSTCAELLVPTANSVMLLRDNFEDIIP